MKRSLSLAVFSLAVAVAPSAHAEIMEVSSTISGGIYADGTITPHFMNYYTGYSFPSSPVERRNFFMFSLAGVTSPIASAKLKLFMPGGPTLPLGFISSDPTETYRISGSSFAPTMFYDAWDGSPAISSAMLGAMFGTLGSAEDAYGTVTLSMADGGMDVVIDFSESGILALNAAIGSLFVVGGRLVDLHPGEPGMPPTELAFAYSDIPHPLMPLPRLELGLVPAPSVLATGALLLAGARRRRRA